MAERIKIKVLSKATSVPGQGVGAAFIEQTRLMIHNLNWKYELYFSFFGKCDLVHVHTINPIFYLKRIFTFSKKRYYIGSVHFLPETIDESIKLIKPFRKIFYKYILSFYRKMDKLVVVNPQFIDKLVNLGIAREKIHYIPNHVSDKYFFEDKEKKQLYRQAFDFPLDKFTVVGVGQLQLRKGVLEFIEIARRLPHITFVWAGGFSFGKITEGYEEIKKAMEDLPENAKFIGIIDRERMNELYNACDLFFLPSYAELFPMCILESMNAGLPLLLRDVDLYEPILFDYYAKAATIEGFVEVISKLESDSEYRNRYIEKSKEGRSFYSLENNVKMWDEFYEQCFDNLISRHTGKYRQYLEDKKKI